LNFIEIQAKSRYGATPSHKNTFTIIQSPENASSYITEKERFNVRGKSSIDIVEEDKEKKKIKELNKIKKLASVQKRNDKEARNREYMHEEKNIYSQLQRTIKLYRYENVK
jgi:hypothetical protein